MIIDGYNIKKIISILALRYEHFSRLIMLITGERQRQLLLYVAEKNPD